MSGSSSRDSSSSISSSSESRSCSRGRGYNRDRKYRRSVDRKRRDILGLERSYKFLKGGSSRDIKGLKDKSFRFDRKRFILESSRLGKRFLRSERDRKLDRKDKRR